MGKHNKNTWSAFNEFNEAMERIGKRWNSEHKVEWQHFDFAKVERKVDILIDWIEVG